jgi:hypothetical protein
MRYKITYFTIEQIGWMSAIERQNTDNTKTKGDLDILTKCILEDATIVRAFHEDIANGRITQLKANYKAV